MERFSVKLLPIFLMVGIFGWSQPKAYTLIVGLRDIDEKAYHEKYQWVFDMRGTSGVGKDVERMHSIFSTESHQCMVLENKQATRGAILSAMEAIGKKVKPGDTFTFYFSGHGYFLPDNGTDEASGQDQVLIAYDDVVLDDDIYEKFTKYFKATKNIMIVDACHSSTSYKIITEKKSGGSVWPQGISSRSTTAKKQTFRAGFLACSPENLMHQPEPFDLIYFGAVEDSGEAGGGSSGGVMTMSLAATMKKARHLGTWKQYDYRRLACETSYAMAGQKLQYHEIGKTVLQYVTQVPFKIL